VQNSLYVQVFHSPILAELLHGTQAVGVSQTLWRRIFSDRAAIPFDIGQSNYLVVFFCCCTFLLTGEYVLLLCWF